MVFSSPEFLFMFLPLTLAAYYLLPALLRNLVLVAASLVFYALSAGKKWPLIVIAAVVNTLLGQRIENGGRNWFRLAITLNLGLLFYFKYWSWFTSGLGWSTSHMPGLMGVSFFVFHSISYFTDIYRKEVPAERDFIRATLYFLAFPQILSGPIVLYRNIRPQLGYRPFRLEQAEEGVTRFLVGLAKKVLVADVLGGIVDHLFALPQDNWYWMTSWVGTLAFALQLYYDFSGYSDMAMGLALFFGLRFPENFHYPYVSRSLADFWTRWHMSLSNWFRSYLFFPILGEQDQRRADWKILGIFTLIGLWHGASWTFLVFGLVNGVGFVVERHLFPQGPGPIIGRVYLWTVLFVSFTLERSMNLSNGLSWLKACFRPHPLAYMEYSPAFLFDPHVLLVLAAAMVGLFPWVDQLDRRLLVDPRSSHLYGLVRTAWLLGLFFLSVCQLFASSYHSFLYFRF